MLFGIGSLWKRKYVAVISILLLTILISFILLAAFLTGESIRNGIKIEETDISGLKANDAKILLLNELNKKYTDGSMTLKFGGNEWTYSLNDISYRFMLDDAVDTAYSIGRTGNIFHKVFMAVGIALKGNNVEIENNYDREQLINILKNLKKIIDKQETNAKIDYNKGSIVLTKETTGKSLDIDSNVKLIDNYLKKRVFKDINLKVDDVQPLIKFDDIKNINGVISSFYTRFNPGDANRSDNIRLACSRINGRILIPGDEFSMNETLGPRTIENGYKDAPVIFKNELIPGPGGGICQVTTTVYDAVLKAKLNVIERSHHSMPLGYVSPGQDATIAEDSIDFKFRNSLDYPVCMAAEVKGDLIYIRILGEKNTEAYNIKLTPVIIAEYLPGADEIQIDDSLPDDQRVVVKEARKGIRVILYRDTYTKDGVLVEREKISEDYYKPSKGLIKVNSNYYNLYFTD